MIKSFESIKNRSNLSSTWRHLSDGEEEEATVQFFRDRVIFYIPFLKLFKFFVFTSHFIHRQEE